MMDKNHWKGVCHMNTAEYIHRWVQKHTQELIETADFIFRHPELSKEEVISSACLAEYLEKK